MTMEFIIKGSILRKYKLKLIMKLINEYEFRNNFHSIVNID
jgi:hypothetical protein